MGPSIIDFGSVGDNAWLAVLADASLKGVVVLSAAALICLAWRRAAAAQHHLIWCTAVCAMLVLPVLSLALPAWQVQMLPRWERGALIPAGDARDMRSDTSPFVGPDELEADRADALAVRGGDASAAQATDAVVSAEQDRAGQGTRTAGTLNPSLPLLALWTLGALAVLAPHVIGLLSLRRLAARAQPIDDPRWSSLLESVSAQLALRRRVRLLAAGQTVMPMTWGLLRPTVLLPANADAWADPWRRVVLLHELAHVKRCDFLTQGLARLACAIYWFHPLVWLAARPLRRYREQACDDHVLAAGTPPSTYATRLLDLAGTLHPTALPSLASLPMARTSHLEARLLAILCPTRSRNGVTRVAAAVTAALTLCAVVPLATMRATAHAETETVEPPAARAQRQDQSRAPSDEEETDPPPPGVVRVFGSERFRTWGSLCLAISHDGKIIAVGGYEHVQLKDLATGRTLSILETAQGADVVAIAFSADGRRLALGTRSPDLGSLEVWSFPEGKKILEKPAHREMVSSVLFAEQGSRLISGGFDGLIKVWDAESGRVLRETVAHEPAASPGFRGVKVAMTRDGAHLVSGGPDGQLKVWNAATGGFVHGWQAHQFELNNQTYPRDVQSLALSGDGKLAGSSAGIAEAKLWELGSGQLLHTLETQPGRSVARVALSPDGHLAAVGLYQGGAVQVWDARTGQIHGEAARHGGMVLGLEFSMAGDRLVSVGANHEIKVINPVRLETLTAKPVHTDRLSCVAFSPDGKLLATAGGSQERFVWLWNVETADPVQSLELPLPEVPEQGTVDLSWSLDGKLLAIGHPDGAFVWQRSTWQRILRLPGANNTNVAFDPTGRLLATARIGYPIGAIRVTDVARSTDLFNSPLVAVKGERNYIFRCKGVVLSSDRVIAADWEGVKAWDLRSGELLWQQPVQAQQLVARPASGVLIAITRDGDGKWSVRRYEIETGKHRDTIERQTDGFGPLALSPDGRFLAYFHRRNVVLQELETKTIQKSWKIAHGGGAWLNDLAFSPDGRYLATANKNGTAYLLEVPQ